MRAWTIVFVWILSASLWAQKAPSVVDHALQAYEAKEYSTAIDLWKKALEIAPNNADIHYNLANAYYQNRQAGWSIYHYEKALKINPDFKEAQVNLEYANKLIIDPIKGNFAISQDEMFFRLFDFFTVNTWAISSIIASLLVLVAFIVYFFYKNTILQRVSFSLIFVFLTCTILSVCITFHQKKFLEKSRFAIVINKEIELKEQPRESSKTIVKLYEGFKVAIDDRSEQWLQIRLVNDTIGWVKKAELKEL